MTAFRLISFARVPTVFLLNFDLNSVSKLKRKILPGLGKITCWHHFTSQRIHRWLLHPKPIRISNQWFDTHSYFAKFVNISKRLTWKLWLAKKLQLRSFLGELELWSSWHLFIKTYMCKLIFRIYFLMPFLRLPFLRYHTVALLVFFSRAVCKNRLTS